MPNQKEYLKSILSSMGVHSEEFFSFALSYFSEANGFSISPEVLQKDPYIVRVNREKVDSSVGITFNDFYPERKNSKYYLSFGGIPEGDDSKHSRTYTEEYLTIESADEISPLYSETIRLTKNNDIFHKGDTHITWTIEEKGFGETVRKVEAKYFGPSKGGQIRYYGQDSFEAMRGQDAPSMQAPDDIEDVPTQLVGFDDFISRYMNFVNKKLAQRKK